MLDAGGTLFGASDTFTPGTTTVTETNTLLAEVQHLGRNLLVILLVWQQLVCYICCNFNHYAGDEFNACVDSPNIELLNEWTAASEQERIAAGDSGIQDGANEEGDEAFGLGVRYYAENFNSTEFGFYYQKADGQHLTSLSEPRLFRLSQLTTVTSSTVGRGAAAVGLGGILLDVASKPLTTPCITRFQSTTLTDLRPMPNSLRWRNRLSMDSFN